MVTGIEAAGLALAIFPVIVQGVSFYVDGTRKIRDVMDHRRKAKKLLRRLEMEKVKFENTCEFFLDITTEEMASLVDGVDWEKTIHERLPDKEARVFLDAESELAEHLKELRDGLGLNEEYIRLSQEERSQWAKFKLVLQETSYLAILEEIREINEDLGRLTQLQTRRPLQRPVRQSHAAKSYNIVRARAQSLHGVLQRNFEAAPCRCNHNASLQLELRGDQTVDVRFKVLFNFEYVSATDDGRLQGPRGWRSLEFQSVDHENSTSSSPCQLEAEEQKDDRKNFNSHHTPNQTETHGLRSLIKSLRSLKEGVVVRKKPKGVAFKEPPQAKTEELSLPKAKETVKRINDLCSAIKAAASCSSGCLGFVEDEKQELQHRLWPPTKSPSSSYIPEPMSLESLLFPGRLDELDRLKLGLKIASAVMQLHATEWLKELWGKRDIFFLQKQMPRRTNSGDIVQICEPALEMPFVRGSSQDELLPLDHAGETSGTQPSAPFQYEKSLFSLGIVLIELWFEEPLEKLRAHPDDCQDDNADYETAKQRVGELLRLAGEDYGLAVSRCINGVRKGPGKFSATKSTLDDEGFKNDVHENVVCLLQKNLEVSSRYPGIFSIFKLGTNGNGFRHFLGRISRISEVTAVVASLPLIGKIWI
ncbi:hypothetical protein FN846DRAFT_908903 [Sphaerosporella brunnea]|uniref:DUF7580 domain-containing protein n=1 Tax=Sphaerosporella brunnea TaxID=1250544 RepID=A0A5J5ERL3_9PEZI|nr:hypothetical protein FN846DRAFT_908903 [Sphaerosporella brunnea]